MYATVGSANVFYTVAGEGLPCLVPSLAGTPIYERTFTPALGGALRLIFVELRANRTAVGDVSALTLRRLLEDMDGLRRVLGLDTVAVLGHSAHSLLGLAYASHFPTHVSHVIVVGGMPRLSPTFSEQRAAYWDVVASPERKERLAENHAALTRQGGEHLTPSELLTATYAADGPIYFFDPAYDCTPLWAGHDQFSDELYQRFWGANGQFSTFDPAVSFPRLTAPVFIAHGVFDFSVPPTVWIGIKETLPDQTYCAFERSGHYPQMEERATFDAAVDTWLRRA
ncbi:MAG: alpha/beta fold hydrolase [Thermomicrobiales bacterium]